MEPLTALERQLLSSSLTTKTDQELAEMMERPVEEIIAIINEMTGGQAHERQEDVLRYKAELLQKTNKTKVDRRQSGVMGSKKAEEKKRQELLHRRDLERRKLINDQDNARRAQNASRSYNQVRKTKEVDYSQMRHVRVNKNTWICVPKDLSDQQAIDHYMANREQRPESAKDIESRIHNQ